MKTFLKENIVLVLGILLPALLTVLFFIATQIGKANIDPPQYSLLFSQSNYGPYQNHKVVVKDQTAYLSYAPIEENRHNNQQQLKLYLYSPETNQTKQVSLPEIKPSSKKYETIIKELSKQNISTTKESPDGYRFIRNYRRNGNIMTEIFGGSYRSRSQYILKNGAQNIKVPNADHYNIEFIGWIIPEQE